MRRDMLWLLSTSSTMSVSTLSREYEVDLLLDVVFGDGERRAGQVGDEAAALVEDRSLDQHAGHFGLLHHLERRQAHGVAQRLSGGGGDLDDDLALLERVVVDPFDGVRRTALTAPTFASRRRRNRPARVTSRT